MIKKIVIAGGTGFIGQYLEKEFIAEGAAVFIISRSGIPGTNTIGWNDTAAIREALEGAAMLINLAGKSVDCRYNEANKKEILRSRVETTETLGDIILQCVHPPQLWLNSSTATIYRHAEDRPMTEESGEIGSGFSVGVAKEWEHAFFSFQLPGTRQVALRIAIVLGKDGGVMIPFMNMVKYGLGGPQGSGRQMFSWLHVADLYRIIRFLEAHKEMNGVYNCSAPNPVTNRMLMKSLRNAMHKSFGLPAPKWLLKTGAVLIKTETELILKSRWVLPEKLLNAGFHFEYPTLQMALEEIIGKDVNRK
ncbi:TIGR01777 family oxidoreductase [Chitinophagaceae bacterium MMS25-I14]